MPIDAVVKPILTINSFSMAYQNTMPCSSAEIYSGSKRRVIGLAEKKYIGLIITDEARKLSSSKQAIYTRRQQIMSPKSGKLLV